MEKLPKDLKRKLALELNPPDLIAFCASNRDLNRDICESKEFWRLKLEVDYPEVLPYFRKYGKILVDPKKTYIRKFRDISKIIDEFVQKFPENVRRRMYNDIYDLYEKYKNNPEELSMRGFYNTYNFFKDDREKRLDFESQAAKVMSDLFRLYNAYRS